MRAFYYLFFILFHNLLSIHIHTCGEKFGGGGVLAPQAPDERGLWSIGDRRLFETCHL